MGKKMFSFFFVVISIEWPLVKKKFFNFEKIFGIFFLNEASDFSEVIRVVQNYRKN